MIYQNQTKIAKEAVDACGDGLIEASVKKLCETITSAVILNAETQTEEDPTTNTYNLTARVFIAPPDFPRKIAEKFKDECATECPVCIYSDKGAPCRLIDMLLRGDGQ